MSENNENNEKVSLPIKDDGFWSDLGVASSSPTTTAVPSSPAPTTSAIEPAPTVPVVTTDTIKNVKFTPNDLPTIIYGTPIPEEYQTILDSAAYGYSMLPKLEYNKLYHELNNELTLGNEETPDPQSINRQLDKIQAAKSRLSELQSQVIQCYNFKKRVVDMLEVAWNKHSSAKSADNRKSDAANLIANFTMDLAYVESLWKVTDIKLKNLDSLHDTVSRKITTMQVELKYFDISRGMSPDFSFKVFSNKLNNEMSKQLNNDENQINNTVDPNQSINAEEQDFMGK